MSSLGKWVQCLQEVSYKTILLLILSTSCWTKERDLFPMYSKYLEILTRHLQWTNIKNKMPATCSFYVWLKRKENTNTKTGNNTVKPVLKTTSIKRPSLHNDHSQVRPSNILVAFTLHRMTTCLTRPTTTFSQSQISCPLVYNDHYSIYLWKVFMKHEKCSRNIYVYQLKYLNE